MKKVACYLQTLLGTLCVTLGVIGILVPVLPTTPFLLLAAFFYTRSSKKFLNWLVGNRLFGEYIENYRSGRGMLLSQKIITISLLWLTLSVSIYLLAELLWVKILLVLIGIGVSSHLISIKTCSVNPNNPPKISSHRQNKDAAND